jgi:hypothetical protein
MKSFSGSNVPVKVEKATDSYCPTSCRPPSTELWRILPHEISVVICCGEPLSLWKI